MCTSEFEQAIERNCKGYTVAVGCRGVECEYAEGNEEHYCEQFFSWQACDSCGSSLGGDRENATMIPLDFKAGDDTMIDIDICIDCVMYWANGELPED